MNRRTYITTIFSLPALSGCIAPTAQPDTIPYETVSIKEWKDSLYKTEQSIANTTITISAHPQVGRKNTIIKLQFEYPDLLRRTKITDVEVFEKSSNTIMKINTKEIETNVGRKQLTEQLFIQAQLEKTDYSPKDIDYIEDHHTTIDGSTGIVKVKHCYCQVIELE